MVQDAIHLLANNQQLNDMTRFCTNANQCYELGIDPIFNLSEFNVTIIIYRHLKPIDRHTKKPPVLVGLMLIHQKKPIFFLCFQLCWSFFTAEFIGSIWRKANRWCFSHTVSSCTTPVVCGIEFLPSWEIWGFLEIMQIPSSLMCLASSKEHTGLADCDSAQQFDDELLQLKEVWDKSEMCVWSSTDAKLYS